MQFLVVGRYSSGRWGRCVVHVGFQKQRDGMFGVLREGVKGTFKRRGTREREVITSIRSGAYLSLALFAIKNAIHHPNRNIVQLRRSN
jgi:hypothetical protein